MLLLAIDTSGKDGSIALVQFEGGNSRTVEVTAIRGGTFSAQLVPQIAVLLAKHNLTKQDIDGFTVVSGPGSFTGLRVGLAAVKALAEVLRKPIAAVSLLEAIALSDGLQGRVLAAMDAGRGNVYCGEYSVRDSTASLITKQVLSGEEFNFLKSGLSIVTFDSEIAARARKQNLPVIEIDRPEADSLARIGYQKLLSRQTVSPEDLDADYISRSGAEIQKLSSEPL